MSPKQEPEKIGVNSGVFRFGGELPVHRLGFEAMQITGAGIWGSPSHLRDQGGHFLVLQIGASALPHDKTLQQFSCWELSLHPGACRRFWAVDGQTGSNPPRTRRTQRPGKGLIASAVEKANSQSTTQPTRTSVFCDFRVFWQPPAVLYVVVQPNHATL